MSELYLGVPEFRRTLDAATLWQISAEDDLDCAAFVRNQSIYQDRLGTNPEEYSPQKNDALQCSL
jgi:hypothetical protein